MNAAPAFAPAPAPAAPKRLLTMILMILLGIFFGWAANSLLSLKPVGVPLVPCKTCAEKCPCPRMSGAIRCGCAE